MAPELLLGIDYNESVDVFSFGQKQNGCIVSLFKCINWSYVNRRRSPKALFSLHKFICSALILIFVNHLSRPSLSQMFFFKPMLLAWNNNTSCTELCPLFSYLILFYRYITMRAHWKDWGRPRYHAPNQFIRNQWGCDQCNWTKLYSKLCCRNFPLGILVKQDCTWNIVLTQQTSWCLEMYCSMSK